MIRRIALFIIGIALVFAAWVLIENQPSPGGPVYQGKTARQWLGEVFTTNQAAAMAAFREMGTNAFPVLMLEFKKNDSELNKLNRWIYPRLPAWLKSHWTRPVSQQRIWVAAQLVMLNNRDTRRVLPELTNLLENKKLGSREYVLPLVAHLAGPKDKECVPVLIEALGEKDANLGDIVFHGLMNIGPPARASVPALTGLLQDTNLDVRMMAAVSLWKIDGQTNVAVAVLNEAMNAKAQTDITGWAPIYLHQMNPQDESLIPVLITKLADPNDGLRLSAVFTLGSYGPAALAAVPGLTKLLDSTNASLRQRVLPALKSIDPEAAAKYEPK